MKIIRNRILKWPRRAMAHRAFARLQTLQNQLAPFDASALEGYLEPQSLLILGIPEQN